MVFIPNRQIKTDFNPDQGTMTLVLLADMTVGGKDLKAGDRLEATRSEARRLLASSKNFKIAMD